MSEVSYNAVGRRKKAIARVRLIPGEGNIVINKRELDDKVYRHHTGYPGGLKETSYRVLMEKKPEFVLQEAVRGMLPKGPLGYAMLKKLHVYRGPEHEHQAQKPVAFDLNTLNK